VHRDVKPSNVLLTVDGRARLVDFGLTSSAAAGGAERITRTGSQVGTLHYMSPQQLRGAELDARADVYSLGATLHELLTLHPPFDAEDRVALERRILEGRPDPIRARNRKVSVDAETVCLQAMALEPGRRYATMRELADDLQRLLERKPVKARPPRWPELAVRWAKQHPGAALAAGLALACAIGVPTGLFFLQRSHSKELQKHLDAESAALGREKDARRGEQEALKKEQTAHAAETAALEDMRRAFEMVTSVFKDATGIYTEGQQLSLREGLERIESRALDGEDAPRARAQVLNLLGQIRMLGAKLDEARPLLERSEKLLRESGQAISRDRGLALQTLGRLRVQTGDAETARKLYAEAIEVLKAVEPYDPNPVAQTIGYDAMSWSTGATLGKAIERYGEAIETFRPHPDSREDGEWLCEMHARRAQLLGMSGRKDDAEADLDAARAAIDWDSAPARLRMLVVNAEATIAMFAKDLDRADEAMAQVVAITRELFGATHPNVATQLLKHAQVLMQKQQPDRAKPLIDEACQIVDASFGANSPQSQNIHAQARQLLGPDR
jgi:tetratricopeptide (TPR) repeat protein